MSNFNMFFVILPCDFPWVPHVGAWPLYEPLSGNIANALILPVCANTFQMIVLGMCEPIGVVHPY